MGPTAGSTRSREQIVAGWEAEAKRRAKLGMKREHTISEHTVKAAGNVAVSSLRFVLTNTTKDEVASRFSGQVVHVWAKDAGGWKLVGDYNFPFGRVARQQRETVKSDGSGLTRIQGEIARAAH